MTASLHSALDRATLVLSTIGILATALALFVAPASADSTPIGPLPKGAVSTVSTQRGALVAVALPRQSAASGLVWRIARQIDARVLRQVSEADVGTSVVVVFKVVGRGKASIVFALTRGDSSSKAIRANTTKVSAS